jgi:hypothetical protein
MNETQTQAPQTDGNTRQLAGAIRMSRRVVQKGSRRATKPKRRARRQRDLKSLVQSKSAAEVQWLRLQGKRGPGGGVEGTLKYAMALAYGGRFNNALGADTRGPCSSPGTNATSTPTG